jgi:hypothetical protein
MRLRLFASVIAAVTCAFVLFIPGCEIQSPAAGKLTSTQRGDGIS